MAYVQHTKCVTVKDKVFGFNPTVITVVGALTALLVGGGLTPYSAIPLLLIVISYCLWWLYDRLVCLGGDRCAIGLLGAVEPPERKSGFEAFDTDYSFNLVLAPHQYQELPADYLASPLPPPPPLTDPKEWADKHLKEALHRQIADDGIQGDLIKETATTGDEKTIFGGKRYDFAGYFSTIGGSTVLYSYQPYLHCEFEGGGIWQLYQAAKAALAFATAAAVVCSIPVIGWVACAVLSVIALVISIVGIFSALNDKAKPGVFDPATGQTTSAMHTGSDILFVRGTWVYDTAHEGWNELHPVKDCQLVAKARYVKSDVIDWDYAIAGYLVGLGRWQWDTTNPADPKPVKLDGPPKAEDWKNWVESWCRQVTDASTPLTTHNQTHREHQWQVHPAIDGCRPAGDDRGPGVK